MSNNQKSSFSDLAKRMVNQTSGSEVNKSTEIEKTSYASVHGDYKKQNVTIIAEDTVITGDIKTKGNLDIKGQLEGNVEAAGYVNINGKVHGDVRADAVTFCDAELEGNVHVFNQLSINKTTLITGNVTASDVLIDGSITGDINVKGSIQIDSNAVVNGNISAASISVGQGAVINGVIETKAQNNDKKDSVKEETTSSVLYALESEGKK